MIEAAAWIIAGLIGSGVVLLWLCHCGIENTNDKLRDIHYYLIDRLDEEEDEDEDEHDPTMLSVSEVIDWKNKQDHRE